MKNFLRLCYCLIVRSVLRKPLRNILTVVGVASGMALFFSIQVLNYAAVKSLEKNVTSVMGETDLSIKSNGEAFSMEWLAKIEELPNIRYATGVITKNTYFFVQGKAKQKIGILAVDLLKEGPFRSYQTNGEDDIIDDPIEFLNTPNGIILTKSFADRYGLTYGSEFELLTSEGRKQFVVGGILSSQGVAKAFDGKIAIMDLMAAQFLFGEVDKVTKLDVILWDKNKVEETKKKLKHLLGPEFEISGRGELVNQMKDLTSSFRNILNFVGILTWFIALFVVYSSITLSIKQKIRELGILRSIGSHRTINFGLFLFEASLIGLAGTSLAIVFGHFLSLEMMDTIFSSFEGQFKVTLERQVYTIPTHYYILTAVIGVLTCFVAGLVPAWRATKVDPLIAIKSDNLEVEINDRSFPKKSFLMGIGLLILFYTLFVMKISQLGMLFGLLQIAIGLIGLFVFLKFFTWMVLNLLEKFSCFTPSMIWLSIKNNSQKFKETYLNTVRLTTSLCFIFFLLILNYSITNGLFTYFESKKYINEFIMADGELFDMNLIPFSYDKVKALESIEGLRKLDDGTLMGWRTTPIWMDGKKVGIIGQNGFYNLEAMKNYLSIDQLSSEFDFSDFFLPATRKALVSVSLLKNLNLKIGDTIHLSVPSGKIDLKVVGSFVDYAYPTGSIYMNMSSFSELYKDNKYTIFGYVAKEGFDRQTVNDRVEEAIASSKGLRLLDNESIIEDFRSKITESVAFVDGIVFIGILVTFIGLFTPILFQVLVRQKEFGVLRSCGMPLGRIIGMLFIENSIPSIISLIYTFSIGLFFNYILYQSVVSSIMLWDMPIYLGSKTFIVILSISVFLSIATMIYPSMSMRKKPIREMIKYE
ncbi:MAG: ABC transporter permease [Bdellovibrionales bacterium]|nr:ABC transporter permease [Bdellovibrionales bacterium]